jgi:hypothetical protein
MVIQKSKALEGLRLLYMALVSSQSKADCWQILVVSARNCFRAVFFYGWFCQCLNYRFDNTNYQDIGQRKVMIIDQFLFFAIPSCKLWRWLGVIKTWYLFLPFTGCLCEHADSLADSVVVQRGTAMDRSDILNVLRDNLRKSDAEKDAESTTMNRLHELHFRAGSARQQQYAGRQRRIVSKHNTESVGLYTLGRNPCAYGIVRCAMRMICRLN